MSGPPLIPLSLTNDGITYTNQATFFSPNQPYFIRNGAVQTNPIFQDTITIQSAANNEETVITARDYQLGPDPQTGVLGGTIIRNIEYAPAPGITSSITSAITASFNSVTQEGSVALYARNINNNVLQNPQLEVTKDRSGGEAVNAYCPIDIEQGVVTPFRIRTDAGGGTDRLQIGVRSTMIPTNRGDIEVYAGGLTVLEQNTAVTSSVLYIQSPDAAFRNTIQPSSITATYAGQKLTALESVFNGLTKQGTLYASQRLDIETDLTNAPANRNRAVRYDGLALNPDSTYGEEVHYWNNTFTDIVRANGNPTGLVVPQEAQINTATLFNCNVSNIATMPVVNGAVRFNSTVTHATSTIMNVANVSTINVSSLTAYNTITNNLTANDATITTINGVTPGSGGFGFLPAGSVIPWAPAKYSVVQSPPTGYLFCNGVTYNIASYPVLGGLLGNMYGGDGVTTFAVPDMSFGRAIIGGCVNQQTFTIANPGTSLPYTSFLGLNNATSVLLGGVEYGTTNRAMYLKPNVGAGVTYQGPGLRAGYSFFLNSGSGQTYTIIDTMSAPFGNNAHGPTYMLFLLDAPMNGTDVAAITQINTFITVTPGVPPGFNYDTNTNLLPDVRASGYKNDYLSYTQRAVEVGPITYNVLQGGVTAAAGAAWRAGDPNLVAQSPFLNGLGSYQDFNNNQLRSPAGSNIPSAYSYAMGYIIKT
jgi:hypothetical protein